MSELAQSPAHVFTELIEQQRRQADALTRLAEETAEMARDVRALTLRQMRVALVYPWPNDPSIVRAVLVQGPEEEHRLAEALPKFDASGDTTSLESWLVQQNFRPVDLVELSLGRRHRGVAAASAPARKVTLPPIDLGPLRLERSDADAQQ